MQKITRSTEWKHHLFIRMNWKKMKHAWAQFIRTVYIRSAYKIKIPKLANPRTIKSPPIQKQALTNTIVNNSLGQNYPVYRFPPKPVYRRAHILHANESARLWPAKETARTRVWCPFMRGVGESLSFIHSREFSSIYVRLSLPPFFFLSGWRARQFNGRTADRDYYMPRVYV